MIFPTFIAEGAFNWSSKGYHYRLTESERDRLLSERLSSDPWQVLARVVELGKMGNFTEVSSLAGLFDTSKTHNIAPAALLVTGDLGSRTDLERLVEVMRKGPDGLRVYACQAARNAGCLWLVPHMLDAWNRSSGSDVHEQIGLAIADLLDSVEVLDDVGPVGRLAQSFEVQYGSLDPASKVGVLARKIAKNRSNGDFGAVVNEGYCRLLEICKSDNEVVWAGERSGVIELANHFLKMLLPSKYEITQAPLTVVLREKFEAATGLNCSAFYIAERFVQGAAVHVLEEFLASQPSRSFRTGARYFFGHIIS